MQAKMQYNLKTTLFMSALFLFLSLPGCNQVNEDNTGTIATTENTEGLPQVVVYKSPTCGCCGKWEEHLRMKGFNVVSHKSENMSAIKTKYGVSDHLASCHTALVDGYVIEGHVPARDIKKLLKERPAVAGLTAPGMPQESPGMQPHDKEPANYDVLSFDKNGQARVYSSY